MYNPDRTYTHRVRIKTEEKEITRVRSPKDLAVSSHLNLREGTDSKNNPGTVRWWCKAAMR